LTFSESGRQRCPSCDSYHYPSISSRDAQILGIRNLKSEIRNWVAGEARAVQSVDAKPFSATAPWLAADRASALLVGPVADVQRQEAAAGAAEGVGAAQGVRS
jgi:hypothetical protein